MKLSKIPDWVPSNIQEMSSRIKPNGNNEQEILTLLLTDGRMKRVWNELTRHKRSAYRSTEEQFHPPPDVVKAVCVEHGLNRVEKISFHDALTGFFFCAYELAVHPKASMTRVDAKAVHDRLYNMSSRLNSDADSLRDLLGDPTLIGIFNAWRNSQSNIKQFRPEPGKPSRLSDLIEMLQELSLFFKEVPSASFKVGPFPPTRYKAGGDRPVVERRTKRETTRAYVLGLADICKKLFNSYLYSTVATTASVALKEQITSAYAMRVVQRQTP